MQIQRVEREGASLLHTEDTQLHTSPVIEASVRHMRRQGEVVSQKPADKIAHHLSRLSLVAPEVQTRLLRIYTEEHLTSDIDEARFDQRERLGDWVDYLSAADHYPLWFSYWSLGGLVRMGQYRKESGSFVKRTPVTTTPFPELNPEALALVYEEAHDHAEKRVFKRGFSKMYAGAITSLQELRMENDPSGLDGSWRVFQEGDTGQAHELAESLQSFNTSWCVAATSMAESYVSRGNFHVYYTRDAKGNKVVPRLAIAMRGDNISEIRGILPGQKVEGSAVEIVLDKLDELGKSGPYRKYIDDMSKFTQQAGHMLEKETLDADDLRLLRSMTEKRLHRYVATASFDFEGADDSLSVIGDIFRTLSPNNAALVISAGISCSPWGYSDGDKKLWGRLDMEGWQKVLSARGDEALKWRDYLERSDPINTIKFDNGIAKYLIEAGKANILLSKIRWFELQPETLDLLLANPVKLTRGIRRSLVGNARQFGMRKEEMIKRLYPTR